MVKGLIEKAFVDKTGCECWLIETYFHLGQAVQDGVGEDWGMELPAKKDGQYYPVIRLKGDKPDLFTR